MKELESARLLAQDWGGDHSQLYIKKHTVDADYALHWHDFFELEIVLRGRGTQVLNGRSYPLTRGSVYLLSPTDFHEIRVDETIEIYNLMFQKDFLADELLDVFIHAPGDIIFKADEQLLQELTALMELLHAAFVREQRFRKTYMNNLLECLFIAVLRRVTADVPPADAERSPVQRALLAMHVDFRTNPSLQEMARVVGLSSNYFSELFHKATGSTYTQYLKMLKLGYAKKLLRSTELPVTEICYASGFESLSNFLKAFRAQTGESPSAYRAALKK